MATTAPTGPLGRSIRFREDDYPFWRDHFAPEARRQMVEDDLRAGETVAVELFALIAIGLALGVGVVLYCL
jgi:hypothetical protein